MGGLLSPKVNLSGQNGKPPDARNPVTRGKAGRENRNVIKDLLPKTHI
jgi:hypothetical protein